MEATYPSETSIHFQLSTRRYVTEDKLKKKTPWPESASELNGPRDRRLSVKLVPNLRVEGATWLS
jgi:hypothetical protein